MGVPQAPARLFSMACLPPLIHTLFEGAVLVMKGTAGLAGRQVGPVNPSTTTIFPDSWSTFATTRRAVSRLVQERCFCFLYTGNSVEPCPRLSSSQSTTPSVSRPVPG